MKKLSDLNAYASMVLAHEYSPPDADARTLLTMEGFFSLLPTDLLSASPSLSITIIFFFVGIWLSW